MSQIFQLLKGGFCDPSSPCPALYECIQSICVHKSIFPLTGIEVVGSILIVFLLGMANVGGMGGAFIASPILMVLFRFEPIPAMRITYCMVFSGAVGNFICNARMRRPNSRKPAIDYDAAVLCIPLLISGASIGVLANSFLPPIVCLTLLVLLCLQALRKSWKKAFEQYRLENSKRALKVSLVKPFEGPASSDVRNTGFSNDASRIEDSSKDALQIEGGRNFVDYPLFPRNRYLQILVLLFIMIGFLMLRGSKIIKSIVNVKFCGGSYWLLYALALISCLIFSFATQLKPRKDKLQSSLLSDPSNTTVKEFDASKNPVRLSAVCFVVGIMSGVAGVGGGVILNPIFLDMGMIPQVATATSAFFVLFTSFISVFQTAISGHIPTSDGLYFSTLSFFGALLIATVLKYLVQKYDRISLVLFLLCIVTFAGAFVVGGYIIYQMIEDRSSLLNLGEFC